MAKLAAGRACHQRGADGVADEVVDEAGWRKRTSVLAGCTLTSTSCGGISRNSSTTGKRGRRDDVAVGLGEGVEDEPVANQALVDEDVDRVAIELLQLGLGDRSR